MRVCLSFQLALAVALLVAVAPRPLRAGPTATPCDAQEATWLVTAAQRGGFAPDGIQHPTPTSDRWTWQLPRADKETGESTKVTLTWDWSSGSCVSTADAKLR